MKTRHKVSIGNIANEIESSSCFKRRSSNHQNELKMLAYFSTKMMVSLHSTFAKDQNIRKAAVEMHNTALDLFNNVCSGILSSLVID